MLCAALSLGAATALAQTSVMHPPSDVAARGLYGADFHHRIDLSSWYTSDKQTFSALFAGSQFDWLLLPMQIQSQGFDPAERLLMDAELAYALRHQGISVPDPYLIGRALGSGERLVDLAAVDTLSRLMGATTIVLPYVGHDEAGNLKVTLAVYLKSSKSASLDAVQPRYFVAQDQHFDDRSAPIDAFRAALPELMKALGLGVPARLAVPQSTALIRLLRLPESPEQLTVPGDDGALADAARLAVLAYLIPPDNQAVDRLFARTLSAALRAPASPQQEFLRAYALLRLGLRPAALAVLQGRNAPALLALAAIANGNLTGIEKLIAATSDYERLILEGEAHDLFHAYFPGSDDQPLAAFTAAVAARSGLWQLLLHRRWVYGRPGSESSNVPLKQVLDQLYPVSGQSLQNILNAQQATLSQAVGGFNPELSAHEHIGHLLREQAPRWCCLASPERPNAWDLLVLIEAWSDENLLQAVQTELFFRGLPEVANRMLTPLDAYYSGRPDFEVLHAQIDQSLAKLSAEPQRTSLRRSANEHALRALIAAGGQSDDAAQALSIIGPDQSALSIAEAYARDYPLHATWIVNSIGVDANEQIARLRRALANSDRWIGAASMLVTVAGDKGKAEVRASLEGRFLGNPDRDQIEKQLLDKEPSVSNAIVMMRKQVQAQPEVWEHRDQLGHTLALRGDYAGAAKVMGEYPGFAQTDPPNGVYLSNIAADTAYMFCGFGAETEARRFLSIATRYEVGSESELSAAVVLSVLNGDLPRALEQTEAWVKRYPDDGAYYYYLSLLHLLGQSDRAWQVFNTLLSRPAGPGMWSAAEVGLRMAGTTPEQLYGWVSQPRIAQAQTPGFAWPARFLLMWASTDRTMSPELAKYVASLGKEPRGVTEDSGRTALYPMGDEGLRGLVFRSNFGLDRRAPLAPQTAVDSDALLFAQALIPFQAGDLRTAVTKFDQLAARYTMEIAVAGGDMLYALPYFAYASAKTGDPLKLRPFLNGLTKARYFEMPLAQAYFAALTDHDMPAALRDLEQAFFWIPNDLARTPSGDYQYVDAAERLYRETGDKRFRERALARVPALQHLQPWLAWPYAVQAELSEHPLERRAALVKALFLDPLSPRLLTVAAEDLAYARAQLREGNPFLRSPASNRTETTEAGDCRRRGCDGWVARSAGP